MKFLKKIKNKKHTKNFMNQHDDVKSSLIPVTKRNMFQIEVNKICIKLYFIKSVSKYSMNCNTVTQKII